MSLLALRSVGKSYGALRVTDGISLEVREGETLGILGPNGAGKTTLFNLISGDVRCDEGSVHYDGRDVTALKPHQRCRLGIGRSYQVPQPFGHMTVFENLVTAACFGGGQREEEAWETAAAVLQQTGLQAHANRLAGQLGLLDRKRLELARALATRPRLLLLDEIAPASPSTRRRPSSTSCGASRPRASPWCGSSTSSTRSWRSPTACSSSTSAHGWPKASRAR